MIRTILSALMLLALVGPAHVAFADDKPTPEQMEQAKKAFTDGKTLFEQNKLKEAVEKFKESYRLSKNPLLLYNIGFTLDQMGNKPLAKIYYDKFLADAPKEAQQRAEVEQRVKQLDKEIAEQDLNGPTPDPNTTPDPNANKPPPDTHKDVKIKPPGTYKAEDFQHQVVTEAPPGKPLDLSAFVPEDSGFVVTMYFRDAGEPSFTSKQMKWRYKELVGRIPAAKMTGSAIQYYIEVKDTTGNVVTRSGKSTSPNLVDIDVAAPPRFYPDLGDDNGTATAAQQHPVDENPLAPQQPRPLEQPAQPDHPEVPGDGFTDVGSQKFKYAKWGFTGAAGLFLATSIVFYVQAGQQADALKSDAGLDESTGKPCTEPCHAFDSYDADLQNAGQRDQTLSRVMLGLGVVSAGVAGYYWYKEFKKHGGRGTQKATEPQQQPPPAPAHDENAWIIVPAVGDHYTGAAATVRF